MTEVLGEFIRVAKYARFIDGSRETWKEQCTRMITMHRDHLSDLGLLDATVQGCGAAGPTASSALERLLDALIAKKIVGSQRALQYGGSGILTKNARIYNCCGSYADRIEVFREAMWLLLCGCGVGMNISRTHTSKMPKFYPRDTSLGQGCGAAGPIGQGCGAAGPTYEIQDSIEGWADALGIVIDSYANTSSPYFRKVVEFDYSKIRPQGALISSSGALAPGPRPLCQMLTRVTRLIDSWMPTQGSTMPTLDGGPSDGVQLRPIQIYDILVHSASAVMSGGIRRSAILILFDHSDKEMMNAKTGNWYQENPQRSFSNNSVILIRSEINLEQFNEVVKTAIEFGEPGFFWAYHNYILYNPCGEVGLDPILHCGEPHAASDAANAETMPEGENSPTGWAFCNLTEINMKLVKSAGDFYKACELASILGTIQATYTSFPFLGPTTEAIVRADPLLGVSMTGMMDNPKIAFDPAILAQGARIVRSTNVEYAKLLRINPASRTTCVKPSGTTSCLLDTSSGIHTRYAKKYLRRVRIDDTDPLGDFMEKYAPALIEHTGTASSVGGARIATFPCEAPHGAVTHIAPIKFLNTIILVKKYWVDEGATPQETGGGTGQGGRGSAAPPEHNVSSTTSIQPGERADITLAIYKHRNEISGMTLLAATGDKTYHYAPFQQVPTLPKLISLYGNAALFASGLIVHAQDVFPNLYDACDTLLGSIKLPVVNLSSAELPVSIADTKSTVDKLIWLKRAEKFANNYFAGDKLRLSYCLKDIDATKKWDDVHRALAHVDIPWHTAPSRPPRVDHDACAGGKCEFTSA